MSFRRASLTLACGLLAATAMSAAPQPPSASQPAQSPSLPPVLEAQPDSFINRVWVVVDSPSVATGTLYTFLSEGTLVIASTTGTPSLGRWRLDQGRLLMIEEGRTYPVEMLELTADRFRIRVRNPGPPTDITLAPAPARTATAGDLRPGTSVTPVPTAYRCGDTTFKVAFEAGMAYVTMPDGEMVTLPRLGPIDADGPRRTWTNGRLLFVEDRTGPTPQVRFARGRMAPMPCEPQP